jgi:hypothetical protein
MMAKTMNSKQHGLKLRELMQRHQVPLAGSPSSPSGGLKEVHITGLADDKVVKILRQLINMREFKYPVTIVDRTNTSVQELILDNSGELSDFIGVWTNDPHALDDALVDNELFHSEA